MGRHARTEMALTCSVKHVQAMSVLGNVSSSLPHIQVRLRMSKLHNEQGGKSTCRRFYAMNNCIHWIMFQGLLSSIDIWRIHHRRRSRRAVPNRQVCLFFHVSGGTQWVGVKINVTLNDAPLPVKLLSGENVSTLCFSHWLVALIDCTILSIVKRLSLGRGYKHLKVISLARQRRLFIGLLLVRPLILLLHVPP